MSENQPINRRQFLILAGSLLAGAGLSQACGPPGPAMGQGPPVTGTPQTFLPFAVRNPTPTATATPSPTITPTPSASPAASPSSTPTSTPTSTATPTSTPTPTSTGETPPGDHRVVHVYDSAATAWSFSTGWYGDYVDQAVVHQMVDQGVMRLTGTATRAAAWQELLPSYVPGQRVAIKVNLNCSNGPSDSDNIIDALIEPVNAVIQGLTEIGVAASDIWVYDAVRWIPDRLRNGCDFPGVQFSGLWGPNSQGFSETERVSFEPPPSKPTLADQRISNVLVSAAHVINMPIMKRHAFAGVTLSFKNHFGSIEDPAALHEHVNPWHDAYTSDYNPMIDMYKNAHFGDKTVLTIGDGLYGCLPNNYSEPEPWVTFDGSSPNSLFFSTDPVAIDCVMYDFLDDEIGVRAGGDDLLKLAAQEGLGVLEHRAPGATVPADWYSLIDYVYLELSETARLGHRLKKLALAAHSPL